MFSRPIFQSMVQQHKNRVFGFARHYLGNQEDAEDVTQEVFMKLWKHGENLEEGVITAWLMRVTKNACLDLLRKRKTYQNSVLTDTEFTETIQIVDDLPQPDKVLENRQTKAQIEKALQRIGEPHRSIIVMREIQDLDYQHIADTLELPLNTVKVYLHRARKTLREHLMRTTMNVS